MPDQTRKYEGLFLFGTRSTVNVDGATDLIRGFLEKHGAAVHVLRRWDERKLAYEVAKQTRGLYLLSFFEAPPSAITNVEREVRLNDDVLRCLITDADHLSAAEVEAMQPQKPAPKPVVEEDDEGGDPPRRRRLDDEESEGAEASDDRDTADEDAEEPALA